MFRTHLHPFLVTVLRSVATKREIHHAYASLHSVNLDGMNHMDRFFAFLDNLYPDDDYRTQRNRILGMRIPPPDHRRKNNL